MNRDGILVIGSANMDMVVSADHFPQPGETILGKKFGMFPGGKGANRGRGDRSGVPAQTRGPEGLAQAAPAAR